MTAHREVKCKKIRGNRLPAKLLDDFLWGNKSNINLMQHTAAHYNTQQHTTATQCNTPTSPQCDTVQHCSTLNCNTLQHTATQVHNAVKHTATHCNT